MTLAQAASPAAKPELAVMTRHRAHRGATHEQRQRALTFSKNNMRRILETDVEIALERVCEWD
jgi:hypothetical protein